ncbi:putative GEM-like protein 8 isoform X1 [Lycium ferocissimum]|uniref:putative GEM-like protein 8 isoform X1 n=1 Tax=Lycium ferocissimum TaxID=112874 RepID=UPI0028160225|nr:putative GEM-like protein 8 isoform X1 [Lycium ferocissimum]
MRAMHNTENIFTVPIISHRRLLTDPANPSQNSKITQKISESFQKDERLWPRLIESVKGKLRLQGAKILKLKRMKNVFEKNFSVKPEEKLVKAAQCNLQTTAGPIAGLLFISTDKAAFCSHKLIKISSPSGEIIKFHYKISIPLRKIKKVIESKRLKKPSHKYIQVVTEDNFDFWFLGFLNHISILKCLQEAIYETQCHYTL